jgi:hypothetical protein
MKKIIVLADRSQTSPSCRSCCALSSRVAQPPTATQTRESTTAMHKRNWRERNVGGIGATVKLWPGQAPSRTPPATQGLGAGGELAEAEPFYSASTCGSVTPITGLRVQRRPPRRSNGYPCFLSRLLRPSKKYCTGTSSVSAS